MNNISRIRQVVSSAAYGEALAEHLGLNVTDLRCLELAIDEPGLTAGRLADLAGITTGAVTGVLDRLERAGFVDRRPDPADRRSVVIYPSPARQREIADAVAPLDATLDNLLGKHDVAAQSAINVFLEAAAAAVAGETARFRTSTRGGYTGNTYTAPIGDTTRGRLVFVSGAPRLALNVAPLGPQAAARMIMETSASRLAFGGAAAAGQLVKATFAGPRPDVRVSNGVVTIRYRRSALAAFSSRRASVSLAGSMPWTIEIQGGLSNLGGSLEDIVLARLDIEDGVNNVDLELPMPNGTVPIRLSGVASSVKLRRPAGASVGLRVGGGISRLRLDRQSYRQVGGDRRFTSEGYAAGTDRFEIEVLGGASDVRVGAA